MSGDIVFGRFMPGNSVIHRIDPRSKILFLTAYVIFAFAAENYVSMLLITLASIFVIVSAKIKFKLYLESLKVILFVVLFAGVLNIFSGSGHILWEYGIIKITEEGIKNSLFVTLRITLLIAVSCVLSFTTSPTDLTDGLEHILKPLELLHIRVGDVAMMMTVAIRFIPIFTEETNKITNAQKARGADMDGGNIFKRVKAFIPVLIPLFVSSFRRADDLALAMECRCYNGGKGRTRMKKLCFSRVDIGVLLFSILIFTGIVYCNIYF